jgi:hypothetical protein
VFTTQPSTTSVSATAFAAQPVVTVQDAAGNTLTANTSAVTLTLTTPAGATLTCTNNPVTAAGGVAGFAGCRVDKAGSYTLTATGAGLTAASNSFNITPGAASKLVYTTQPSAGSASATPFAAQPVVAVQDAAGNTVTTDTSSVTLALTTPAGATLSCTTNPVTAVSGTATFANCSVDKAGTYTLKAIDGTLTVATSNSVSITAGAASRLVFSTQPSASTVSTTAFTIQPAVTVQDAFGNTVTTDPGPIALALTTPAGATLTCTTDPAPVAGGVAAFAGCRVDKAGTYTLKASEGTLTATSTGVTITVGPLVSFGVAAPASVAAGTAFAVTLTAQDAGGNAVTTYANGNHAITWSGAATSPKGTPPAYPSGSVNFAGGVSTTTLMATLSAAGANTLTASATSPTLTGSAAITVTALAATNLAWTHTSNVIGNLSGVCSFMCTYTAVTGSGTTFKAKVTLTDLYGNPVNASSAISVTVAKSAGTFTNSPTVAIAAGTSESTTGGDGTVAGEITFTTRSGSWSTDTLSMTSIPAFMGAAASFTK